jgi:hypothetical protein
MFKTDTSNFNLLRLGCCVGVVLICLCRFQTTITWVRLSWGKSRQVWLLLGGCKDEICRIYFILSVFFGGM